MLNHHPPPAQAGGPDVGPDSAGASQMFTRDMLFPRDIAERHGLDPDTLATLEAPNMTDLYKTLCLLAAHFAVDLDQAAPLITPSHLTLPKPPAEPSPASPAVGNVPNASNSKQQPPAPKQDIPPVAATTTTTTTSASRRLTPMMQLLLEAAPNQTFLVRRSISEPLSSLWSCPRDDLESIHSSASDSSLSSSNSDSASASEPDQDQDPDPDADADADADAEADGANSDAPVDPAGNIVDVHTHGLRQTRPPRILRFQLGLGFSKMRFKCSDDEDDDEEFLVVFHHLAVSPPAALFDEAPALFRSVVAASSSSHTLRVLCALASKWKRDLANFGAKPRIGTFTLFRYKTFDDTSGRWEKQRRKRSRPKCSIVLRAGMLDKIVQDLRDFCARDTKQWYHRHGIPHRRSLMFYGPPGTGKTSTIKMLAGMFGLNACFLSFTSGNFSNQLLHDALSDLPGRPLLVLEDVDVLFNEDRKNESENGLTFSGLLNALDGIVSVDGVISIFTTNHIERLDKALLRAGRIDRRFEFPHPNAAHIEALFQSFYPEAEKGLAKAFVERILRRREKEARSIATMQQHFIFTRRLSAQECVDKVDEFFEEFYTERDRSQSSIYV